MEIVQSIEKRGGGIYLVTFRNGVSIRMPAPVLRTFRLNVGDTLDIDAYWRDHHKEIYRFAIDLAVFLLSGKDYSRKMLQDRLARAGYPAFIVEEVLHFMHERGYLDDARFAERIVEQKAKTMGENRIRQYLAQKGIDREITQDLLEEKVDDDQQLTCAVKHIEKYLKSRAGQEKRRLYGNAIGMLARKGFSFELANRAYHIAEESAENPDN